MAFNSILDVLSAIQLLNLADNARIEKDLHRSTSRIGLRSRSRSTPSKPGPLIRNSIKLSSCFSPLRRSYSSLARITTSSFHLVTNWGSSDSARVKTSLNLFLASASCHGIAFISCLANLDKSLLFSMGMIAPCANARPPRQREGVDSSVISAPVCRPRM